MLHAAVSEGHDGLRMLYTGDQFQEQVLASQNSRVLVVVENFEASLHQAYPQPGDGEARAVVRYRHAHDFGQAMIESSTSFDQALKERGIKLICLVLVEWKRGYELYNLAKESIANSQFCIQASRHEL